MCVRVAFFLKISTSIFTLLPFINYPSYTVKAVKYLLQHGADPNNKFEKSPFGLVTPLFSAIIEGMHIFFLYLFYFILFYFLIFFFGF